MNKPLNPGEFNCRIKLCYTRTNRGPLGEPLPDTPVEAGEVWAKGEPISHKKVRTADQEQVVEKWTFTAYPRRDVDIDWKVETSGRIFTVCNVDRSKNDRIVITAEVDTRHDRTGN
ncbi:phage head closure protein [Serratia fonticola]|uniref:phage head closure protein n=1 Tax=Serratia fonticola TaxID=47917 RepID=UPI0015C64298|nr:phage head closure protein [Serratia fonticola]NYA15757.1 phage head closure protein [Serratia fonticola]NYA35877.1 phage head closure protein [Serratia fonticola]